MVRRSPDEPRVRAGGSNDPSWWKPTLPGSTTEEWQSNEVPEGTSVGPYVVEELRASGGFSIVYRGRHVESGETVAIKVLHRYLATSPKVQLRFQREVEAVRALNHPNIVAIRDVGELSPGRPYYAMEWLDGRTLDEEVYLRGRFSLSEVLEVLEGLCPALATAHEAGIIHRDLKASNVMLLPNAHGFAVKLVDFGIVKLLESADGYSESGLTTIGASLGTPQYMAPEQIMGGLVDSRTDIYSLGVLIFQLLTGRLPFNAPSAPELGELHLHATPPRPSSLAPVPQNADVVVRRCLDKNPDRRYQTVSAVLEAMREADASARAEFGSPADAVQPEGWLAGDTSVAVGLYVELEIDGPDEEIDDELLDRLDDQLEECRSRFVDAGLCVAVDTGTALLAARKLPDDEGAALAIRREVLRTGLDTLSFLTMANRDDPRLHAALSAHVAPAATTEVDGELQFVDGDLLAVGDWTSDHLGQTLTVTREVVEGLRGDFAREESEGRLSMAGEAR